MDGQLCMSAGQKFAALYQQIVTSHYVWKKK